MKPGGKFIIWLYGKEGNGLYIFLFNNLRKIRRQGYMAGGPGRQFMPQTDVGGNIEDKLNALAIGKINITDPF